MHCDFRCKICLQGMILYLVCQLCLRTPVLDVVILAGVVDNFDTLVVLMLSPSLIVLVYVGGGSEVSLRDYLVLVIVGSVSDASPY